MDDSSRCHRQCFPFSGQIKRPGLAIPFLHLDSLACRVAFVPSGLSLMEHCLMPGGKRWVKRRLEER